MNFITKDISFKPIFIHVINKKGYYLMDEDSLTEYQKQCRDIEGISIYEWFALNGFKYVVTEFGKLKISK